MKRTPNVIVIEDNDDDFEALKFAFEEDGAPGLDIERCTTGPEAKHALDRLRDRAEISREDRVLIILDLRLPGLSGFDLLKTMRHDSRLRRIPVVILSSSSNQSDVIESYTAGANAYIRKPRNFEEYVDMVGSFRTFWTGCAELPVLGQLGLGHPQPGLHHLPFGVDVLKILDRLGQLVVQRRDLCLQEHIVHGVVTAR